MEKPTAFWQRIPKRPERIVLTINGVIRVHADCLHLRHDSGGFNVASWVDMANSRCGRPVAVSPAISGISNESGRQVRDPVLLKILG